MEVVNKFCPPNHTYKIVNPDEKNFVFRIKEVKDKGLALKWLKEFETKSNVKWRIKRTYKESKGAIFQTDYRCQHRTDPRRRVKQVRQSKNTDCAATLQIKIERDPMQFPCICKMSWNHNHQPTHFSAVPCKTMSAETKENLRHLFLKGHTPTSARHDLQNDLMLTTEGNYKTLTTDSSIIPTPAAIYELFDKDFKELYGDREKISMKDGLKELITEYSSTNKGQILHQEYNGDIAVAICTNIMKRTLTLCHQAKDMLFVEASSHIPQNHRMYLFTCCTVAGCFPIGCLITSCDNEDIFRIGIQVLLQCLDDEHFAKKGPEVFVTDDLKKGKILREIWPASKPLLNQFHVFKCIWRWLSDFTHGLDKSSQQELYFLAKQLVFSQTEENFLEKLKKILTHPAVTKNKELQKYITHLLKTKKRWHFQKPLSVRGNHDYVEILCRIMKDTFFSHVKTYNLVQLVDYIVTRYDSYLEQQCLDFYYGKLEKKLLMKLVEDKLEHCGQMSTSYRYDDDCYIVKSSDAVYCVDIESCFCTCVGGNIGQICEHVAFVLNLKASCPFVYTDESRKLFFTIATGKSPSEDFLIEVITASEIEITDVQSNDSSSSTEHHSVDEATEEVSAEELVKKLHEWIEKDVYPMILSNPSVFKPAVENFLSNAEKFVSTEKGLISAFETFATGSLRAASRHNRRKHETLGKKASPARKRRSVVPSETRRRKVARTLNENVERNVSGQE